MKPAAANGPPPIVYASPELLILGPMPGGYSRPRRETSLDKCHRCGGREFVDVPIHGGVSQRRECATGNCGSLWGFSVWYGVVQEPQRV